MKTLIVYESQRGATQKIAEKIKNGLAGDIKIAKCSNVTGTELKSYDKVIIGTPIYAGTLKKEIKTFCTDNKDVLETKKVYLFLCGMDATRKDEYIANNFSGDIVKLFADTVWCGGAVYFSKMNFFIKFMIKKIMNSNSQGKEKIDGKKDIEMYDEDQIQGLIDEVNRA